MVPYEENEHFTGRETLLAQLCTMLCETASKQWNHRVALHGLGGIGKTQLALKYVYTHRPDYERVYWISSVNEATLLSGFYNIAERTRCIAITEDLKPSKDLAKSVISWLNDRESWLLIFDNVDDLTLLDDYLPTRAFGKHTLITTRDRHMENIPAKGLEVGELDVDEAVDLLLLRAKVETGEGKAEAREIVEELGYLPLAIEQAAAFIREASRDLSNYLTSYRENRKTHHARQSKANRNYYKETIDTTWRLSFEQIEKNNSDASILLRLLAFLNPDCVLTDFLISGRAGLNTELQEVVNSLDRFYEALGELERFSLIRRQTYDAHGQQITIHRLVQTVIKDEMSAELGAAMIIAVIGLC